MSERVASGWAEEQKRIKATLWPKRAKRRRRRRFKGRRNMTPAQAARRMRAVEGLSPEEAASNLGVCVATYYRWKALARTDREPLAEVPVSFAAQGRAWADRTIRGTDPEPTPPGWWSRVWRRLVWWGEA
jgi:DNA invertase Pin-like site-specific DNA recombinase